MKTKILTLIGILVFSIGSKSVFAQNSIDSIITIEKLREVVYYLAADSLQGRKFNTSGGDSAAKYISGKMEAAGVKKIKGLSGYLHNFGEEFKYVKNVTGVLPGTGRKDEVVVISAHYDHLGVSENWKPKMKRDVVYNGANDDASGVAVMLSLASYFASIPHQRTIVFVAFSGEEVGLWGSRAFCTIIKPDLVVAQINLEMLGRSGEYKKPFITGHWHSDLRDILNKTINDSLHTTYYFEKDNTGDRRLFVRSDNFPLARLGIPAHTIMLTTDLDAYYHTLKDEAPSLDYINMCGIARNIALAITPLVQSSITPKRIDTSNLPAGFY